MDTFMNNNSDLMEYSYSIIDEKQWFDEQNKE